ncbi:MAG TPA: peptide chain release factor N(5)-glutamine methyltransferase [Nitrospira sp.]|nr:peptide chain release factor N(5)-glutamine methyltransferase [Nitrospira sp.]
MTRTAQLEGKACTIDSLIVEVRRQLRAAGIESADQEALWLIEHALSLSGLRQVVDRDRLLSEHDVARVKEIVARRIVREPLQYILGTQEFCGLEFEVNSTVLIPRPETELLVRETARRLPRVPHPTLIDVGTGSGCLAVSLARSIPGGRMLAIDLSARALEMAKRNARRHSVETSITWLEGNLFGPLARLDVEGAVTAIVSNPPYICESDWFGLQPEVSRYEPRVALVAGPRGTELHERLLNEAIPYLAPGGLLLMELGLGQSADVQAMVRSKPAYSSVETVPDEAGIDRVLIAVRAG